ncbi:serine/threonine-protein kinase [Saccharothrix variisporea]|uniref:Serine/threonine protein kinase n=1 Tax=Saccharothrix variisporea TaxID=543527 RepID=A0A495X2K9_9PSEU|nr:serine/threonine-protein kinase [Saccharothrix variisporea]RKT66883.1 serine/threonine protein kinase [Saccharothrix variisporea]
MRTGDVVGGRYELEDARGSGSGGMVWSAFDRKLKRRVALKRPHAAADEADRARFRREAETAAQVHHPNAVAIFDTVDADDCWLVMEHLPADSLDKVLAARGALPPERVARIGVQIAGALAAVHAKNIVHRDVKPGNILVTDDGLAKLTDFGISIWREGTRTDDGRISGTPSYTAPEVASGYPAGRTSDVFSLGATLFAAVEGEPPFGHGEPHEVLRRARRGEIPPMRQAGPLTPLLAEMLRKRPETRPTADEVRSRLKEIVGDWEPPQAQPSAPARARRPLQAAAGALVVAAVVAGALAWQNRAPAASPPAPRADLIGDERTADVCALLDLARLRRFGKPEIDTTQGNFNRCDAMIDVGAAKPVDVEVQVITRTSRGVQGRPGEILEEPSETSECDRTVVVDDVYAVRVSTKLKNPPLDLCTVETTAIDGVLATLAAGPLPRRATPFPEGSLAHVDACTLLDAKSLATLAGIDAGKAVNVFGHWGCKWFDSVGGPGINLRYDQHMAQELPEGSLVDLGGHPGYVKVEVGTTKGCTVNIPHRPARVAQRATIDLVVLTVAGDRPNADYCPRAQSLATVAAANLPS